MSPVLRHAAFLLALAGSLFGAAATAQPARVAPVGAPWPAGAGFVFDQHGAKTRRSVSGIACGLDEGGHRVCLLAFDEGTQARFARLGDGVLQPLPERIDLGTRGKELDAEGAAIDGDFFYVTGSHAVKRKDCKPNPGSGYVLRLQRDARTGLLAGAGDAAIQRSQRLRALLEADPALKARLGPGKCLGEGGLDIEGLAVHGGRLHFGLRGPTDGADAFIVSVDAQAFFSGAPAALVLTRVPVGVGLGLRDMAATGQGLLLLVGPDDRASHAGLGWAIWSWDGGDPGLPPKALAQLDLGQVALRACDKETKPEGLTVLQASAHAYRVLVLSDGMCDGGPLLFDVPR
ncbi:DUF3616 domain-containing protein [Pseudorhodoferax sp. LjRoot39]|uniref:DUF3616 domain-containing protein n=1 Tax=Pseudorhodoferax sp. LjRoot39 TaxID=3342328 RepID=UPI003ECCD4F0